MEVLVGDVCDFTPLFESRFTELYMTRVHHGFLSCSPLSSFLSFPSLFLSCQSVPRFTASSLPPIIFTHGPRFTLVPSLFLLATPTLLSSFVRFFPFPCIVVISFERCRVRDVRNALDKTGGNYGLPVLYRVTSKKPIDFVSFSIPLLFDIIVTSRCN